MFYLPFSGVLATNEMYIERLILVTRWQTFLEAHLSHFAFLAQSVAQLICNQWAEGSSPLEGF